MQQAANCLLDDTSVLPCPLAGETAPFCAAAVSLVMATCPLKLQVCRAAGLRWHELVISIDQGSNQLDSTHVRDVDSLMLISFRAGRAAV